MAGGCILWAGGLWLCWAEWGWNGLGLGIGFGVEGVSVETKEINEVNDINEEQSIFFMSVAGDLQISLRRPSNSSPCCCVRDLQIPVRRFAICLLISSSFFAVLGT